MKKITPLAYSFVKDLRSHVKICKTFFSCVTVF